MSRQLVASTFVVLLASSWAFTAGAAPKDAAARKLQKEAINVHYLGTKFDKAIQTLRKALGECGASGCSPQVVAELHRDIGMILVVGKKQPNEGKAEFEKAVAAYPAVKLDPDLSTDEVKKLFAEAKKSAKGAPAAGAPAAGGAAAGGAAAGAAGGDDLGSLDEVGGSAAQQKVEGNLKHEMVTSSQVRTPLPLYVELPEGTTAQKLVVHYRPYGTGWKQQEMYKVGQGYGVELPCKDLGVTGQLKYYIEAMNKDGEIVAYHGSRRDPVKVSVGQSAPASRPSLPGKPPPAQCEEASDCPPDFPGCGAGASEEEEPVEDAPAETGKRFWVGVSVEQGFQLLDTREDVCTGFDCYFSDGDQFEAFPITSQTAGVDPSAVGNKQNGGFNAGNLRLKVNFDYRLFGGFTIGGGAGFVLFNGPDADFPPLHFEARAAYQLFGYERSGLKPFFSLAAGAAAFASSTTTDVAWCGDPDGGPNFDSAGNVVPCTQQNLRASTVDVWNDGGPAFASLGAGLRYLIRSGAVDHLPGLQLKYTAAFPEFRNVVSVEAGYQVGF